MNKRLIALAMSLMLGFGPMLAPLAMAQDQQQISPDIPIFKTAIAQNNSHLELTMGKAKVIHLSSPATRVSISDPQTVGVVLISPKEIELIGKAIGAANLLVWTKGTGQNFLTIDLAVHRDVAALADKIQMIDPGINIIPVAADDSVILTGVAESIEKAQLAYDLTQAYFTSDKGGASSGQPLSSNSPGSSTMSAGSPKIINLIRIMGQPQTKAEMVQEQLKRIDPRIKLDVVPGYGGKEKAILTGRVRNASMVSKAINLTSVFYGTPGIKVLTGPGGNIVPDSSSSSTSSSATGGFTAGTGGELMSNFSNNVLHGSVLTDGSGNVVSMLQVEERPEIRCSIKFLEVDKTDDKSYQAATSYFSKNVRAQSYAGSLGHGLVGGTDTLFTTISSFMNQVNGTNQGELGVQYNSNFATVLAGLVTTGRAKVLAEPTITSISGEPASFLAGGEFPIPLLSTTGSASVMFKEFGIRLNVLSTVTDRGTIHMQVSPEVSTLDPAAGITVSGFSVPGLKTRRSETVVEMHNGDNFVLSGLYNDNMNDVYNKTPLLGQIPILGALFRSRAFQRSRSELIIVIHPEIVWDMDLPPENSSGAAPQKTSEDYGTPSYQTTSSSEASNTPVVKTFKVISTKTISPDSQVKSLSPTELAAQLRSLQKKNPKAFLKEVKKEQKADEALSQKLTNGPTSTEKVDVKMLKLDEKSVNAKPSASKPVSSFGNDKPAIDNQTLDYQKNELEQLMNHLQSSQTVIEEDTDVSNDPPVPLPPQATINKAVLSKHATVSLHKVPLKKVAFQPLHGKQSLTAKHHSKKEVSSLPPKPVLNNQKHPTKPREKQVLGEKPHKRVEHEDNVSVQAQTRQFIAHNVKMFEKSLSRLLTWNNN